MSDTRPNVSVLSLVNQKGGCGKTTTAVNLAGALAARGETVLLVDLDPQAHATMALGCALEDEPSVAEVLLDEATILETIQPAPGGIDLLPADPRLGEFEEVSERLLNPEQRLARALAGLGERYRWVIVDCPPRADGVLCANALFASTTALLIVETGAFALQGALQALRVFDQTAERQGYRPPVKVVGTLFDRRTKFARELLVAMHGRFGDDMFDTVIRTSVRLREAPAVGLPIHELAPTSRAAADFDSLVEEVLAQLAPKTKTAPPQAATESPVDAERAEGPARSTRRART
ncbi:MAG: ParA family protein [Planctomycetota bacterium]|nr:ParA family protein [Planctomycetota bacterium]